MRKIIVVAFAVAPLLCGCVRTVVGVATAPVKVASQAADWATTSQDESDRNYGRKMRKQEAAEARKAKEEAKRREREQAKKSGDD
jgi:hypothetical protein